MIRSACRTAGTAALALLTALGLAGCSSADDSPSRGADGSPSGTVTVFAAASLKESFTALGEHFEKEHPGTEVTFNFGGSDSLAARHRGRRAPRTSSPPPAPGPCGPSPAKA